MSGSGPQVTSIRIPASSLVHTKNIRRLGMAITKCFAEVVGLPVRASLAIPIEISTRLIGAMCGPGSARVRCRLRKDEDRHRHSGSAGLTLWKPHYCASLGEDFERIGESRVNSTDV